MVWPLCWRSTLDEMRLRLTASREARQQAEEALGSAQIELRKMRLLVAQQAEALRRSAPDMMPTPAVPMTRLGGWRTHPADGGA